jgi:phytoene dehydrogenase-like protein
VGAGTHPGGGLPGVITSGKIVAQLISNIRVADEKANDLILKK